MASSPITVRLHRRAIARADGLVHLLHATGRRVDGRLVGAFAFKNDELRFARRVLQEHARFWLFRCSQRAFAADFIAVDMSCTWLARRPAWCLDLKQGAPVRVGGGGAGNAFVGLSSAVAEIAGASGALASDHAVGRATGDGDRLVDALFRVAR